MSISGPMKKVIAHYDKLILVLVVVALIGSLSYLVIRVGMIKSMQEQFNRAIAAMSPRHPVALVVDVAPYEQAQQEIDEPFQMPAWSNALFVPETRAWCLECLRPVAMDEDACPFCGAKEKGDTAVPPDRDLDQDDILDVWELKYGMNPYDPSDANRDQDADGFSALEEFRADPSSDPTDPASTPPVEAKLRVVKLAADPFNLLFKSKMTLPGNEYKFQLNLRGGGRTYFLKLGESVGGFKLVDFEDKSETYMQGNMKRTRDVSVLTLQRADKKIHLVRGQTVQYDDYTAHLKFLIDGSTYELKIQDEFELKVQDKALKYRLIGIDSARGGVVIKRLHDGVDINIWKDSEGADE